MQSCSFLGCQPFMTRVSEAREKAVHERFNLCCLLSDCSASFDWSRRDRIHFADKSSLDCSVFVGFEKDPGAATANNNNNNNNTSNNSTNSPCLLFLLERSFYLIDHTVIGHILLPKLSSHVDSGNSAAVTFIFSNDLTVKLQQKQESSLEKLAKFVYYLNNALTPNVRVYEALRAVASSDEGERARYSDAETMPGEVAARLENLLTFIEKTQALVTPTASADCIADSLMRCGDGKPIYPQSSMKGSECALEELAELARGSFCDDGCLKSAGRALLAQGEEREIRVRKLVEEVCRSGGKRKRDEVDTSTAPLLGQLQQELRALARVSEDFAMVRCLPRSDIL